MDRPIFKVPLKGQPPKKGWALRHLSGAENVKRGEWVSVWKEPAAEGFDGKLEFSESDLLVFDEEQYARNISERLRTDMKIDTEVVRV